MSASKSDTGSALQSIGSDLKKVDAYLNLPADYDELPEITEEEFARSVACRNGEEIDAAVVTEQIEFHLDVKVMAFYVEHYGLSWQKAMNDHLRQFMRSVPHARRRKPKRGS